jgi:hypothetical protein
MNNSTGKQEQKMGYREQIKQATSLEQAKMILGMANLYASEKAKRRCKLAFDQLPFTKAA